MTLKTAHTIFKEQQLKISYPFLMGKQYTNFLFICQEFNKTFFEAVYYTIF